MIRNTQEDPNQTKADIFRKEINEFVNDFHWDDGIF